MESTLCLSFLSALVHVNGFSLFELPADGYDFGESVSIYGHTAVVGAGDSTFGKATIFQLNETNNNWYVSQELNGTNYFGSVVSIHNTTLFVVAAYGGTSFIYEFDENRNKWVEVFSFVEDLSSGVINNKYAVAGEFLCGDYTTSADGCAYVYKKEVDENGIVSWPQVEKLTGSYGGYDRYGTDVDLWNDQFLIIGSPGTEHFGPGAAFIYEIIETESSVQVVERTFLEREENESETGFFGAAVAIFDQYAAVATGSDSNGDYSDDWSVIFYERNSTDGNWNRVQRVFGPNTDVSGGAMSMSMFNNYCIVGNQHNNEVLILHRSHLTQQWEKVSDLSNVSVITESSKFGYSVGIHGEYAIIGDLANEERAYIVSSFKPDYLSNAPTTIPSDVPTQMPTTPTLNPTFEPTHVTSGPTSHPSLYPSSDPSVAPSDEPTVLVMETTSLSTTNGALAEAEAATSNCSKKANEDSIRAVIGVLAALVCLLFVSNVGIIIYFTRKNKSDEVAQGEKDAMGSPQVHAIIKKDSSSGEGNAIQLVKANEDSLVDNNDELYQSHQMTTQGQQVAVTKGGDMEDVQHLDAMGFIVAEEALADGAANNDTPGSNNRDRGTSEGQDLVTGA